MQNADYNILISKIDAFIRKYYYNRIVRGLILSASIYLFLFLFFSITEYYSYLSTTVRTSIFYSSIFVFSGIFIWFIVIPFLKLNKIGNRISYKQASDILAQHFSALQDKLKNTLELAEILDKGDYKSQELVLASINQRISVMKPLTFTSAVKIKQNSKYLKYLVPLILVLFGIMIYSPNVIKEGSNRIINHNIYFEPEAPFNFNILNDTLSVEQGNDITIELKITGNYIPDKCYIYYGGNSFLMKKNSVNKFEYTFNAINNSIDFQFYAEEYYSRTYTVNVLPSPIILDFTVNVEVPEYTGESNQVFTNVGDISAPAGSKIRWEFNTKDIDSLWLIFNDTINKKTDKQSSFFQYEQYFKYNSKYSIAAQNQYFINKEVLKYRINITPDLYPTIAVETINDSLNYSIFYFRGIINDDYGFKNLFFCYRNKESKDSITKIPLQISPIPPQEFYYSFDFNAIKNPGDIEYYFEVWDNDGVNGSKSSQSSKYDFKKPTQEEINKLEKEASENIQSTVDQSMKLAEELQEDIQNLREDLINNNKTNWEKTQIMEQISKKQKTLEEMIEQLAQDNAMKNEMMNNLSDEEMEMLEKQEQIQELLENVLDDELKKMMEEFNKLMDEYDEDKLNELSEDMEMSYKDLSEQLDRNLEMLKRYEVEKEINKTADKLQELSEEQFKLSEETDNKKLSDEKMQELSEKQKQQSEDFNKAMEDYKKALEKNEKLDYPMNLDDLQKDKEKIQDNFQKGNQNMEQNKNKKASENQQKNSQDLQKMAQSMQSMMQAAQQGQQAENMDDLRQIIDNLVRFSFDQEKMIDETTSLSRKDPKYVEITSKQNKIADDFGIIRDSLEALAKRTPQLNSAISKEINEINRKLADIREKLEARNSRVAAVGQQYIMTSANNLALLLSELLQAMQQQMAQQMQGDQQCQKPGQGKPSLQQMRMQQQSLKQQLQSMMEQMKGGKDGQKGKMDKNALNKRLTKMLAQQEMFQQAMSKLMKNNSFSPESVQQLKEINKMIEQNETDIVNKRITPNTMKRQEQIITRLLQAENAEYEREIEKKRESRTGKNEKYSNPEEIFEYKGMNSKFNELLNTSNLRLKKYYKNKYKEYLINLNE